MRTLAAVHRLMYDQRAERHISASILHTRLMAKNSMSVNEVCVRRIRNKKRNNNHFSETTTHNVKIRHYMCRCERVLASVFMHEKYKIRIQLPSRRRFDATREQKNYMKHKNPNKGNVRKRNQKMWRDRVRSFQLK